VRLAEPLAEIEARRGSRVLVLAASNLELELLPPLYDALREIGHAERLDVLVFCRGGVVNAARRIALMLHQFTGRLSFIIPDRCESSGTLAALAAHEIVAGPAAIFTPIDPLLQASPESTGEGAVSAEDVRLFGAMAQGWFGLEEAEARSRALAVLCESIFPTTLTSFYRSTLEIEAIALELLSLHMPEGSDALQARIVDRLLHGHHSHSFALTREELRDLGLPVHADPRTEDIAWEIARDLRGAVGGGTRATMDDDWCDAVLATRDGARYRWRSAGPSMPIWKAGEAA
jgi:hypothetical protein